MEIKFWIHNTIIKCQSKMQDVILPLPPHPVLRIRIRDPVPFDFWPGSGIGFFPDPGSQTHIFESLVTIFWVKSSLIL